MESVARSGARSRAGRPVARTAVAVPGAGVQRDARARDYPPAASGRLGDGFFPVSSVSVETAAALLVAAAAAAAMRVVSAYMVPVIPLPFRL